MVEILAVNLGYLQVGLLQESSLLSWKPQSSESLSSFTNWLCALTHLFHCDWSLPFLLLYKFPISGSGQWAVP